MGFVLVTAVLVVSLGRVGDIYGRVRMYNLGFAVFTFFSIMLSITWLTGPAGALVDHHHARYSRASAARSCSPTRPRS